MDALARFVRRLDAASGPAHRALTRSREAARLGIDLDTWSAALNSALDLERLRALHIASTGERTTVRRTLHDGSYTTAPARAGRLRTKPQGFRAGDHVEPAWVPGQLERGLVALLQRRLPDEPAALVDELADVVTTLCRAQPFTGINERLALVVASWALRRAGLPVLPAVSLEHDPRFVSSLAASARGDGSPLATLFAQALWEEALAVAEWLAPVPPAPPASWTLRDEHAASTSARRAAVWIAPDALEAMTCAARAVLEIELSARFGRAARGWETTWLDAPVRMQAAWDSLARGRTICPHEPIVVTHATIDAELDLRIRVIAAAAGRGISGATSLQLVIELDTQPTRTPAPALLLVPDEPASERDLRVASWLRQALPDAIASSPVIIHRVGREQQ